MTIQQVTIGGQRFNYDTSAIRDELQKQNVGDAEIARILAEIGQGNVSSLNQYGLGAFLVFYPDVPPPSPFDMTSLNSALEKLNTFNFLEVMRLLHETSKQLREANREMRHADRDIAVAENMAAADKIRSGAWVNLLVGIVQGGVSIGMGLYSVKSAVTQRVNMESATTEKKVADVELKQVKADNQLAKSQLELGQAKTNLADTKARIQKIESLQSDVDIAQSKFDALDAQYKSASTTFDQAKAIEPEWDTAKAQLETAQKALNTGTEQIAGLRTTETIQKAQVDNLTAKVQSEAVKATESNQRQIESLEKSIKADQAEIDTIKAKSTQNQSDAARLQALEGRIADDKAKLKVCQDNAKMYGGDPTSVDALAGAEQRLAATEKALGSPMAPGPVAARHAEAQANYNEILTAAQAESARIQGLNTGSQGVGQILGGVGQMAAERQRADGAERTANAQKAASAEAENAEFQKSFSDLLQHVQDILKQYMQAQNQANAAIYRNM